MERLRKIVNLFILKQIFEKENLKLNYKKNTRKRFRENIKLKTIKRTKFN